MRAAVATRVDPENPSSAVEVRDGIPDPQPPVGWEAVHVRAASLNHHDLWNLRGMGAIQDRLPAVLGSDGAGVTNDGRRVIIHALISPPAHNLDETLAPGTSLLSDRHDGTLAEQVAVPSTNLLDMPAGLTFEEAACLPTAWLTAFRMLFTRANLSPGQRVLVQGAGGGLATAAIMLARTAGLHVTVTSRNDGRRKQAVALGADVAVAAGERVPQRVHAVIDTVGEATWDHSLKALRPGGILVTAGATSGGRAVTDVRRVYLSQLRITGTTMGSRQELAELVAFVVNHDIKPPIAGTLALEDTPAALRQLAEGTVFGKLVIHP